MIFDRKKFGFRMKVVKGGFLVDAKAGTEGLILNSLEFGNV